MSFLDIAKKRFTSRSFMLKPIPHEKLMYVLEAGRVAPTMGNTQSQRIVVLETKEYLKRLNVFAPIFDAPLALLVCSDSRSSYKDPKDHIDSAVADATVVATHLVLAAADIGLGSIWISKFNPEKIETLFNLPPNFKLIHILGMGFPLDSKSPTRHGLDRLSLDKIVTFLE